MTGDPTNSTDSTDLRQAQTRIARLEAELRELQLQLEIRRLRAELAAEALDAMNPSRNRPAQVTSDTLSDEDTDRRSSDKWVDVAADFVGDAADAQVDFVHSIRDAFNRVSRTRRDDEDDDRPRRSRRRGR